MKYEIRYSDRKTLSLEISRNAEIIVRAPKGFSKKEIEKFVSAHEKWIKLHLEKRLSALEKEKSLDKEKLKKLAEAYIPKKTEYFSKIMNADYSGVKITSAKTRYGSCSADNRLCFSLYLMAKPKKAIDYVIIHELAHTFHHNHSKSFYAVVEKYMPDYKIAERMLKE